MNIQTKVMLAYMLKGLRTKYTHIFRVKMGVFSYFLYYLFRIFSLK